MWNYLIEFPKEHQLTLHGPGDLKRTLEESFTSYGNTLCLKDGATLQGRKAAFSRIFHRKKYIPVLLSSHPFSILIPSEDLSGHKVWICRENIACLQYYCDYVRIVFLDQSNLKVRHPKRLQKNMQDCTLYSSLLKKEESQKWNPEKGILFPEAPDHDRKKNQP